MYISTMLSTISVYLRYHLTSPNYLLSFNKKLRLLNFRNISTAKFEKLADETLESLCEYIDELIDKCNYLPDSDVTLSNNVLKVFFGEDYGTYVINKQIPNSQIWLSSPISGPKRYDFHPELDAWIYRHDNQSLHQLLQKEISKILNTEVDFFSCDHSGIKNPKK